MKSLLVLFFGVVLTGLSCTASDEEGFVSIFNGKDLSGWQGATACYGVRPEEPGVLQCMPEKRNGKEGGGGQLCTTKEYRNFALRFEFCLPPMGNNGLGIRMTDVDRTAAYYAMCELQLLDDNDTEGTTPYQFTGAVYGVFPPRMDNSAKEKDGIPYCPNGSYSFAPGHWNFEDVRVAGEEIEVRLNGVLITKGNLAQYRGDGDTPDGKKHPGLKNKRGFIGWLGHGCNAKWRNIRIREFPDDITMDEMNARLGSAELPLPGEPCTKAAIAPDPFPDRMSAYVWRNWFVVPHDRLAAVVGATESDLEDLAAEMGLPRKVEVLPEWRRKGYITVVRRNWNLLDYPQLLQVVDMTREEMRFSLLEDDFLFVKLGNIKPKCGALRWNEGMGKEGKEKRGRIAAVLKEEGVTDFAEEPRFTFVKDLSLPEQSNIQTIEQSNNSPFDFRMIFSYFADYADPLADDEVGSYPEGLLQKLAAQGVNAVWLHTVLRTLAKDPKYPEFGEGSERRIANLTKLVKRCEKHGIKVFLYMNEPRAMPDEFFRGHPEREAFRGCDDRNWPVYAMCTSCPEVRRWVCDSIRQVFAAVPGLGGIFTITMSENVTNCASRGNKKACPRCRDRNSSDLVAEINTAMIEGMRAGNPDAVALLYDWEWSRTDGGVEGVMAKLPKQNVRILSVSESGMPIERGGVKGKIDEYSVSAVGPGEVAKATWASARANGIPTTAKVQANCSWEIASFPYLPVIDLVAEHAFNLMNVGVGGVVLSWSHGCCPAPNLTVFRDIRRTDGSKDDVLGRIADDLYGSAAAPAVRSAWRAFADGYREFPFSCSVAYDGPMHMGPANPLYLRPTGFRATMVGIPYDDMKHWCAEYPAEVWSAQMEKVYDGFVRGCEIFVRAIPDMPAEKRSAAERELRLFTAEKLHFRSCVDQVGFYLARGKGDVAAMRVCAARELKTAKEILPLVRRDSSFGYESSNQYFYIPQDIREKILSCRQVLDGEN